ncbi:hypothetical protein LCGC14_2392140 [marine sediment metagenome]|uniref:Uncharacterized protein n=1 Tax=marine sediment metagenome TaxID=412755 RepID=A0A0F9EA86_9ZZZZ
MKCYYEDVNCGAGQKLTPAQGANWCISCQLAKMRKQIDMSPEDFTLKVVKVLNELGVS